MNAPARWSLVLACATAALGACSSAGTKDPSAAAPRQRLELNQGWSEREAEFYQHATEGTPLAPLDFLLALPDPAHPTSRFVERLPGYGFIPGKVSPLNPHGLPVGLATDERPVAYGDRAYVGITCSACHTRQMTFRAPGPGGSATWWDVPVHGGPGLIDMPRFKQDLYDAFFALLQDDALVQRFGQALRGRAPTADDVRAWRDEIREFTGPVAVGRALMQEWKIAPADFGPGNLNALSQGNYNNVGLGAWLVKKGLAPPSATAPLRPRLEGAVNYPPMWFAHGDTWAQWFAEIHHPGPRNWLQAVSTSEVRPPRMIAAQKAGALLGSIHFENIAQIQRSLELLRTPKWPEHVFGTLDPARLAQGRAVYERECAGCHERRALPPNEVGIVLTERRAFDVGTDPVAYTQFAEAGARRADDLKALSEAILALRRSQLAPQGEAVAANYMKLYSRGRPNQFALAREEAYADGKPSSRPRSGAAYWAPPLQGIFASSPYLHNGSVRSLRDLLTPPEQRPRTFRTGSTEFDATVVGLKDEGPFVYDTGQPGKGNGGHPFGTGLADAEKAALIEYLKSL